MGGGQNARSLKQELWFFASLLAICNLPVIREQLVFWPATVDAGQLWRVFMHPFVHVSWYHLLLDGAAFLFLYAALRTATRMRRLVIFGSALIGSLGFAWSLAPKVQQLGLCGLSGVAHGIMAATALDLVAESDWKGWLCLVIVAGKSVWEALTGQVLFAFLHFGLMGTPIAISHLGGVLGGLMGWGAVKCLEKYLDGIECSFVSNLPNWSEGER